MKRVGIWGSYNYGNFGDDLMAICIAEYLKQFSIQPIVYRLDKELAKAHYICSENDISKFVEDSDFIIIGGGGMLVNNGFFKRILSPVSRNFELDFFFLLKEIKKYKKFAYAISIGGDMQKIVNFSKFRKDLFLSANFKGGTVRLISDIEKHKSFKKDFLYFPDILFYKGNYKKLVNYNLSFPNYDFNRYKYIGLNLFAKEINSIDLVQDLLKCKREFPNVKFVFLISHLKGYDLSYEFFLKNYPDNCSIYRYDNISDFLSFLSNLSLIISSKLHIGLVSLMLNVPFLSFKGKEKTRNQLNQIKKSNDVFVDNLDLFEITIKFSENSFTIENLYSKDKIINNSIDSFGHYLFLDQLIKKSYE